MRINTRVIISAFIEVFIVTLLFWVVPVTDNFIASYIFALIAVAGINGGILFLDNNADGAVKNYAYIYISVLYAVVSVIFSVIACVLSFNIKWTIIIHAVILGGFSVVAFNISSGNRHIDRLDSIAEKKHEEFEKEKKTYWE